MIGVAVFALAVVIIMGSILTFVRAQTRVAGTAAEPLLFSITSGQNVFTIADALYARGEISSPAIFVVYAYVMGLAHHFQAGTYQLDRALSVESLAHLFVQGPPEISILIPPGATVKEIDGLLSRNGILSAGALAEINPTDLRDEFPFLAQAKTLEGFLMPNTYAFYLHENPRLVAETMVRDFANQTKDLFAGASGDRIFRWVVVASLLEKEVITDHDKAMVAGIINNRLADAMPLQIDAAVSYGACGGVFAGCPIISAADIAHDTPYNTYRYRGLPPAPISNPTLSSLRAAVHPIANSYRFYLSDPKTDATIFSVTLAEHARNRKKYLGVY